MQALKCNTNIAINGNNFKLCDIGGKLIQLITTTTPNTTTTTTTTLTKKIVFNIKMSAVMGLVGTIFIWAVKKWILWKKQRMAKHNGESTLIIKLIDAVIDELEKKCLPLNAIHIFQRMEIILNCVICEGNLYN
jgi:hypothetical protein